MQKDAVHVVLERGRKMELRSLSEASTSTPLQSENEPSEVSCSTMEGCGVGVALFIQVRPEIGEELVSLRLALQGTQAIVGAPSQQLVL